MRPLGTTCSLGRTRPAPSPKIGRTLSGKVPGCVCVCVCGNPPTHAQRVDRLAHNDEKCLGFVGKAVTPRRLGVMPHVQYFKPRNTLYTLTSEAPLVRKHIQMAEPSSDKWNANTDGMRWRTDSSRTGAKLAQRNRFWVSAEETCGRGDLSVSHSISKYIGVKPW